MEWRYQEGKPSLMNEIKEMICEVLCWWEMMGASIFGFWKAIYFSKFCSYVLKACFLSQYLVKQSKTSYIFISKGTLLISLSFLTLNWENSALINWHVKWDIYTGVGRGKEKKLIRGDEGESEYKGDTMCGIVYWVIFFGSPMGEPRTRRLTSI